MLLFLIIVFGILPCRAQEFVNRMLETDFLDDVFEAIRTEC